MQKQKNPKKWVFFKVLLPAILVSALVIAGTMDTWAKTIGLLLGCLWAISGLVLATKVDIKYMATLDPPPTNPVLFSIGALGPVSFWVYKRELK